MKSILAVILLIYSVSASAVTLNKIVVFGDSLSDNGNLYEYMDHKLPISPPYFEGRFSNGPVWVELLAQAYYPHDSQTHLLDYAFGGAGISEDVDDDDVLFTLRREIDGYLLAHQNKADDQTLYVIWMGANNYLAVPDDEDEVVSTVNLGILHDLKRLALLGAKHILVVGMPDLGTTPAANDFDAVDVLTSISNKHNTTLKNNMVLLQQDFPDVQWLYFDVMNVFNQVFASPQHYGFTNLTQTCYEELLDDPSNRSILNMVSQVKLHANHSNEITDACSGYFFFDPVHPTKATHQIMAVRSKKMLDGVGIRFE